MYQLVKFDCEQIHDMYGKIPIDIAKKASPVDFIEFLIADDNNSIYLLKHNNIYKAIENKTNLIQYINTNFEVAKVVKTIGKADIIASVKVPLEKDDIDAFSDPNIPF